jgi:PAS domain S-box-containing protein
MIQKLIHLCRNFQQQAINRIAQPYSTDEDSLVHWRSQILFAIIMTGWILGTVAIIASIGLYLKEKTWELALLNAFCFVLCAVLIFSKRLRYEVRTSIALLIFYAVGITVILSVGPLSGGAAWLFSFVVLVAVLLGSKPALIAVFLNACSLSLIAWLISTGKIDHNFVFFETHQSMIATGTNFIVLNIIVAISVAVLVKGLIFTLEKERALTKKLELEIQERKIAEKDLLDSETKYRLLAENAKDVIWVRDLDMNLVYVSPSVERVRGYTVEEVMSQSIEDVLTPDSLNKALRLFSRFQQMEDSEQADQYLVELEHRCKNGRTIW